MDLMEHVAARIRELRQSYGGEGISQDALARALDISPNTISRWETGAYKPSIQDLNRLAGFFGTSILAFFPNAEQPENASLVALLRAAGELPQQDIDELRKYAEFRRAQKMYREGTKPRVGRKPRS